jgi:hypothetical protein
MKRLSQELLEYKQNLRKKEGKESELLCVYGGSVQSLSPSSRAPGMPPIIKRT